jgi:hypothetical protein
MMANPLTCSHNILTHAVKVDSFEQYIVCVSCNTKMVPEWLNKRNWDYDIDNNVWVFVSKKEKTNGDS